MAAAGIGQKPRKCAVARLAEGSEEKTPGQHYLAFNRDRKHNGWYFTKSDRLVKQVSSGRGRRPFSRFRTHVRQCPDDRAKTTSRGFSRSDKTPLLGNYPRCTKRPPCSPTAEQPSSSYRPNVGQGSDNPPLRRRRMRPLGQGRIRAMSEPNQSPDGLEGPCLAHGSGRLL